MEADGVPAGYDRWKKIGVVRSPVERLWSLYKFLQGFDGPHDAAYIASMRSSVAMPFTDWIVTNDVPFTSPYDSAGRGRFFPMYTVRHALPENRKSQFMYLRPDLGTQVWRFDEIGHLAAELGLEITNENRTASSRPPLLTTEAEDHVMRFFAWDLQQTIATPVREREVA